MPSITIPCPDSVLISLKETPEMFAREATKLLVVINHKPSYPCREAKDGNL